MPPGVVPVSQLPPTELQVEEMLMPFGWRVATTRDLSDVQTKSLLSRLLLTGVLTACSGSGLSPERKACLETATSEAERIECNKASAI